MAEGDLSAVEAGKSGGGGRGGERKGGRRVVGAGWGRSGFLEECVWQ